MIGKGIRAPVAGVFQNSTQLSNGGELITLVDRDLVEIRSFEYEDEFPWPAAADGDGFTLTLVDPSANPDHALAGSWRSSVSIGGSPGGSDASNFADWTSSFGGNLPPNGDGDDDGYANLLEYGLATSPLFRDEAGSVVSVTPDHSSVSFRKNKAADDLVLRAEFSTDLVNWESALEVASEDNGDGSETVTAVPPPSNAFALRRFVRLRALLVN